MEYFAVIIPKLINLLLLLFVGVFAVRIQILTKEKLKVFQDLLMKIVLPVLSFHLLLEQKVTFSDLISLKGMVLAQLCIYPVLILAGVLCTKLSRMKYPQCNVHWGCMISGNYAYVVLPLVYALYEGTYATVFIPLGCSVEALVIWTVGITLYTWGQGGRKLAGIKKMVNPITFAVLLGFLVNTLAIPIPVLLKDTIAQISSISTPLGMIYLGACLCFMEWRNLDNLNHALLYVVSKMVVVPLLVYIAASYFFPETESIILMLTCASPSTTIAVMIAKQYELDADYAGEIVSVSTLSCALTIPFLFFCVSFL